MLEYFYDGHKTLPAVRDWDRWMLELVTRYQLHELKAKFVEESRKAIENGPTLTADLLRIVQMATIFTIDKLCEVGSNNNRGYTYSIVHIVQVCAKKFAARKGCIFSTDEWKGMKRSREGIQMALRILEPIVSGKKCSPASKSKPATRKPIRRAPRRAMAFDSRLLLNWALNNSETAQPEEWHDCTIETMEGKKLHAYRLHLAQHSPVFRQMLANPNFTEGRFGIIKIDDFGAGPVLGLLCYLSRGFIPEESKRECGQELFRLADKYELLDLRAHMAFHLAASLTEYNVSGVALLASMHRAKRLKLVRACTYPIMVPADL